MQVTEDVVTSEDVAAKITSAKVVVTQNEIPEAATATTVALASGAAVERGFPITVSNPAPAPDVLAPALCADIDILVLNESEAASLAGKDTPAIGNSATEAEVEAFVLATADRLRPPKDNRGRVLVVTRGSKGAAVAVVPASGSSGATAVIMVKGSAARRMADTVGAGDAFVGALAATLSRVGDAVVLLSDAGKVSQAVERACAVATMTVEHQGTQTSYPTREQALERIPHLESAL
jgi:ribokinase